VKKLVQISELSKILNLINPNDNKPQNYILRYWEKEFKQIKPKIINKRRYYSDDLVELIKFIKFLIKDKGMTISGVKKILNLNINKLDDHDSFSLKDTYFKAKLKIKSKSILLKLKKLKNYGKKNSLKS
tara:strand:- start:148 stop:534 length:387 start_codon:yes stop_codon:yes gene_type:complete